MRKGFFFISVVLVLCSCKPLAQKQEITSETNPVSDDSLEEDRFGFADLQTNWKKHSIPLDSIFDGGPEKNGIPAIDFPEFVSVSDAKKFLSDADFGILLTKDGETKFYSYNILNWHEIVNDKIGGQPVAVTFCPLCGSAIVYSRLSGRDTLSFGVSGKLYESNLLMFDEKTESLWLQQSGECVAGDHTGKQLELVNSSVISFEEVLKHFPGAAVLSINTGFDRNYTQHPYYEYNSSEDLYFPVSKTNDRFRNKDIMYVVKNGKSVVAFSWLDLLEKGYASQATPDGTIEVSVRNFIPSAIGKEDQSALAGYFTYWFSWYSIYGEKGLVWEK